jgi:mannose/fructose/N-acetylgalactosamine-specific phosphotransferase system component IIC
MILTTILVFALLGALLGLDVVSFPQAMLSRPIVASTIAGALGGSAGDGLLAGVFLEMMALETLPVGASRYPEWGTASVVGGALYVSRLGDATSALLFAMLGAMLTAWAGGWSMYALRRLNGRWTKRALPALEAGSPHIVSGLQMLGLSADFLRGFVLTGVALALLLPLTALAVAHGHGDSARIRAVLVAVAVAVAGSAAWKLSHGSKHGPWFFLGGLAIGCAMLLSS